MHTIDIGLGSRSYQVFVGHGVLSSLGSRCEELGLGPHVAVLADQPVAHHYLRTVTDSLHASGFQVHPISFRGGDPAKTLASADSILGELIRAELDRSAWLVTLGGGVVGDLGGFVAATYLRGIDFVQVPTTLLAQVDASVGGKTAVNHALGKNLVGAFHQPRLVLVDTDVLRTLPRRERVGGLGEVIKHAIIRDSELFAFLERELERIVSLETSEEQLDWLIARNVGIKAAVVAADERESGVRALLNYGHTVGHAIEAATGYTGLRHGEAVILGMVAAGHVALERGLWKRHERDRQDALLQRLDLPGGIADLDPDLIVQRTHADKKRRAGRLRFVLPHRIGAAQLVDGITPDEVRAAVEYVQRTF